MNRIVGFIQSKLAQISSTNESGQTLVEYALIIALVSVAIVGSLTALSGGLGGAFTNIVAQF